jgi:hypothetical protein
VNTSRGGWRLIAGVVVMLQGALLRVDPDRHRVTGSVELGPPAGDMTVGPLAVGAGAVWVGTGDGARVTARVDPVSLRVTGDSAAMWRWWLAGCCGRPAARAGTRSWGSTASMPARCVPIRRWWSRTPRAGATRSDGSPSAAAPCGPRGPRRSGCGGCRWRAVGPGAIGVSGFAYGLAADERAAWVLSGTSDPGIEPDRTGRLRRLDQRTGEVTVTTPLRAWPRT